MDVHLSVCTCSDRQFWRTWRVIWNSRRMVSAANSNKRSIHPLSSFSWHLHSSFFIPSIHPSISSIEAKEEPKCNFCLAAFIEDGPHHPTVPCVFLFFHWLHSSPLPPHQSSSRMHLSPNDHLDYFDLHIHIHIIRLTLPPLSLTTRDCSRCGRTTTNSTDPTK